MEHESEPPRPADLRRRSFLMSLGAGAALLAGAPAFRPAYAQSSSRNSRLLRQLASQTRGRLITQGQSGYVAASHVYNTRYDSVRPLAILKAASESDVQAAVKWAATNDIPITARSGGHSYGGYSTIQNGLVVDLSNFNSITSDRSGPTARVGAGTQLINMYSALAKRGLTVPGGSCPSVCVGGLALGGGVGLAARRFGTTSDNILSARVVTADGRVRTADARRDADLYWACRGGGGGNFGIVTSFRFQAHAVGSATYFFVDFDWSDAASVITAWQRWAPNATDDIYSILSLQTGSGSPSVRVFGQYFGSEAGARNQLRGLTRSVTPTGISVGTEPYIDLMLRWAGCADISLAACHTQGTSPGGTLPRSAFFAKSAYVAKPMNSTGARSFVQQIERRQSQSASGSGAFLMDSYGGQLNEPSPTATAFVHRNMVCSIQYLTYWTSSATQNQSIAWLQGAYSATRPYTSAQAYQNYIDPTLASWQQAYYAQNLPRLRSVKRKYDPDDVFRFKQGIRG